MIQSDISADDGFGDLWRAPVALLLESHNPWEAWAIPAISRDEVAVRMFEGKVEDRPYRFDMDFADEAEEREFHIRRIAYLALNRDDTPIAIDVGIPSIAYSPRNGVFTMIDGNHRLAAADFRGDLNIVVSPSGSCDRSTELFGEPLSQESA